MALTIILMLLTLADRRTTFPPLQRHYPSCRCPSGSPMRQHPLRLIRDAGPLQEIRDGRARSRRYGGRDLAGPLDVLSPRPTYPTLNPATPIASAMLPVLMPFGIPGLARIRSGACVTAPRRRRMPRICTDGAPPVSPRVLVLSWPNCGMRTAAGALPHFGSPTKRRTLHSHRSPIRQDHAHAGTGNARGTNSPR